MKTLILLSAVAITQAIKVSMLSDVHIYPRYDPLVNNTCYCYKMCTHNQTIEKSKQSSIFAPFGRLYCDPPQALTESFLQKLQGETPDVLIVTGDVVGHDFSQYYPSYDPALYETLKAVHANFSSLVAKYLPNTLFLPTFGNNDFKFHYMAPTPDYAQEYFSRIFDQWFTQNPTNKGLLDLDLIKQTFMTGGYYRVNLPQSPSHISILALNSICFSLKEINFGPMQDMQLQWLEEQLESAESHRKFILVNHIYYGVQQKDGSAKQLWTEDYTYRYGLILERYASKILIELSGHEHTADLRYHLGSALFNSTSLKKMHKHDIKKYTLPKYYHNIIINPGVTSFDGANPGYTVFDLDLNNLVAKNLKMNFFGIEKTYNWTTPYPSVNQWPWTTLDFNQMFNLTELTPQNIDLLHQQLSSNDTLLKRYLSYKIGYDPDVPLEFQKAMDVYEDFGMLTAETQLTYPYKCLMNKSIFVNELKQCYQANKPKEGIFRKYLGDSYVSRVNPLQRDPTRLE